MDLDEENNEEDNEGDEDVVDEEDEDAEDEDAVEDDGDDSWEDLQNLESENILKGNCDIFLFFMKIYKI